MVRTDKIQRAMQQMNISIKRLAVLSGSTPRIITRITKTGQIFGRDKKTISRICSILGLDLDDFRRGCLKKNINRKCIS